MEEVWKDVVGYEGIYEVSNKGRVRTHIKASEFLEKNKGYLSGVLAKGGKVNGYDVFVI